MRKTVVGITVVGKDREGIVAAFTNFAFSKGGNIEQVNQNVIKGLFGMYLEVSFSKNVDIKKFDSEIQNLAKKEKMDVSTHHETNSQKNIAVFVTKEPLCLEVILKNAKSLKGNISVIIGTEKTLAPLAKKANIPFVAVEEKIQSKAEEKIIDICKKYNFFSCGINLNFFSNSIVNKFIENDIQVTVYAENNISKVQAHNLWNNNVTSIFIDDPTEYI